MADLPLFPFTTQEDWYGELVFLSADSSQEEISLEGRAFEMPITESRQGGNLLVPVRTLTMDVGGGLSLKSGSPNTLVFRVDKDTARTFSRTDFTAHVLEVVGGERHLFMPVNIRYTEPSGILSFVSRFVGVKVSFSARSQPIVSPVAITGRQGAPGATIITGFAPPVPSDGKNGDYWIEDRTSTNRGRRMYGPKTGGAWPPTPWNIQVTGTSDVPGLVEALGSKADLVATGMSLASKLATVDLPTVGITVPGTSVSRSLGDRFVDYVNLWDHCDKGPDGRTEKVSQGFARALKFMADTKRHQLRTPDNDLIITDLGKTGYTTNGNKVGLLVDLPGYDIEIHCQGSRLLFDGVDRSQYAATLAIAGAGRVKLTGTAELSYVKPSFVQGVCKEVNLSNKTATFQLEKAPTWGDVQRLAEYDADSGLYVTTVLERPQDPYGLGRALQSVGGSLYQLSFAADADSDALARVKVNSTYVLMHQIYGAPAIQAIDARALEILGDWRVLHSASFGLGANHLDVINIGPGFAIEKTGNDLLACPADGLHINNTSDMITINARRISALCDDGININTLRNAVYGVNGSENSFIISNASFAYNPDLGDHLVAISPTDGSPKDLGVVTAMDFSVYPPKCTVSKPLTGGFTVGQTIDNVSRSAPIRMDVGVLENIRGNGIVARSYRGTDIRARVKDTTDGGILAVGYGFPEGPYPQHVNIDAYLRNVGRIISPAIWVAPTIGSGTIPAAGATKNVTIKARIERCSNIAVFAQSIQSLYIDLDLADTNQVPGSANNGDKTILIDHCDKVMVEARLVGEGGLLHVTNSTGVTTGVLAGVTPTPNSSPITSMANIYKVGATNTPRFVGALLTDGGNASGSGGAVSFGIGELPDNAPMAAIKGSLDNTAGKESQGSISFLTRLLGVAGQALTERMRLMHDGRLGLGTINPSAKLDVIGDIKSINHTVVDGPNATDAGGSYFFGVGALPNNSPMAAIKGLLGNSVGTESQGGIAFLTRVIAVAGQPLVERMRLMHDGRLGLGTSTPVAMLDVIGSLKSTTLLVTDGANALESGGSVNFGVGAIPTYSPMASIKGVLAGATGTETQGGIVMMTRALGAAGQALVERLRLTSDGRLGLGISNPRAKLDVVGDVRSLNNFVSDGPNATDAGGSISFGLGALPDNSAMAAIKGGLVNATGSESQGSLIFLTRPFGAAGQELVEQGRFNSTGEFETKKSVKAGGALIVGGQLAANQTQKSVMDYDASSRTSRFLSFSHDQYSASFAFWSAPANAGAVRVAYMDGTGLRLLGGFSAFNKPIVTTAPNVPSAASDAASTQDLVNALRAALASYGLVQ